MQFGNGLPSAVINLMITFFVINLVVRILKKNKARNEGDDKSHSNKPADRETTLNMSPGAKNLKHEQTSANKADLNLKRCSNCGGEIPLTMMKCELCGHRQAGCSAALVVLIMIVVIAGFALASQNDGYGMQYYFTQFMEWLSSL
jgi:preprotein translocase subunit SecG